MDFAFRADPVLGGALAYWKDMRGHRRMPARRDFDPTAVPMLLPHLQLIDIVDGRFRYRLVGTELVEMFGRDYTGQFPDELFPGPRGRMICDVFSAVLKARQPMFLRNCYITTKNLDLVANRLYLPLSEDDEAVNMILGALTFDFGTVEPLAGAWGSAELAVASSHLEPVAP
jgi:hypothetical protein